MRTRRGQVRRPVADSTPLVYLGAYMLVKVYKGSTVREQQHLCLRTRLFAAGAACSPRPPQFPPGAVTAGNKGCLGVPPPPMLFAPLLVITCKLAVIV